MVRGVYFCFECGCARGIVTSPSPSRNCVMNVSCVRKRTRLSLDFLPVLRSWAGDGGAKGLLKQLVGHFTDLLAAFVLCFGLLSPFLRCVNLRNSEPRVLFFVFFTLS